MTAEFFGIYGDLNFRTGPGHKQDLDGSLYIVDMYRGNYSGG